MHPEINQKISQLTEQQQPHPQWPCYVVVPAWLVWPSFMLSDHLWPQSDPYLLSQPSHTKAVCRHGDPCHWSKQAK